MRVLVCGGRDFDDAVSMRKVLFREFDPDDTVTLIHGDAKGADRLSEQVLTGYFRGGFQVKRYPADWKRHGTAAGPIRNKQMLEEGKPDFVVAFPGGSGTAHMVKIAKAAGIRVIEIKEGEEWHGSDTATAEGNSSPE